MGQVRVAGRAVLRIGVREGGAVARTFLRQYSVGSPLFRRGGWHLMPKHRQHIFRSICRDCILAVYVKPDQARCVGSDTNLGWVGDCTPAPGPPPSAADLNYWAARVVKLWRNYSLIT